MALREEELALLFETIDAMIDARIALTNTGGNGVEYEHAEKMKQDCIDVIAFSESLDG